MNEEYKEGDFGHAVFLYNRKCMEYSIDCYGTITSVDKKYIWFTDNDGFPYLISKKEFKFTKEDKK
jgi:hypothetical protein